MLAANAHWWTLSTIAILAAGWQCVADRIEFIQCDLADLPAATGSFDVIMGMIYVNDPRRDLAQQQVMGALASRCAHPGTGLARALARAAIKCPTRAQRIRRLRASKPIRYKPVEAHMLFGCFADKATVDLCRDTHHEPA